MRCFRLSFIARFIAAPIRESFCPNMGFCEGCVFAVLGFVFLSSYMAFLLTMRPWVPLALEASWYQVSILLKAEDHPDLGLASLAEGA